MTNILEFNRITFGIPVERFRVEAYIALEERLPVVTEYLLRLLRICDRLPLSSVRDYFGFSDGEILSIVESLCRQGLLEVDEEEVTLSQYAVEKFDQAGGDHPRFSKVELKQDDVVFDLITFSPLTSINHNFSSDNMIRLDTSDDCLGSSIDRARSAYHQHYHEIASKKSELREKSFGIYSIETVESLRRSYLPIPVSFLLDSEGQVQRRNDEIFENMASSELVQEVSEKVTMAIPKGITLGTSGFEDFVDTFNIPVLRKYLIGNRFDFKAYVNAVHVEKTQRFPKGTTPIFGNLYLAQNRDLVTTRLRHRRLGQHKFGKLSTSLVWLIPDYTLWGRGDSLAQTVSSLTGILRDGDSPDDLYICAYAEQYDQQKLTYEYKIPGLRELHFARPLPPDGRVMDGMVEILLYPTSFVFAMYHLPIPGNSGLWAPIGFVSTLPKHLEVAHKLVTKTMSGERYAGRARFNPQNHTKTGCFESELSFLHYDSVSCHQSEHEDIEDDGVIEETKSIE